jgi:glycogen synthase
MTADTVGGVWTYALELARVLSKQGTEIALATMGAPLMSAQWREADRISNLRIFESTYQLEWMHEPWEDVREAGEWLLELERGFEPDIVHLSGYTHGALPFRAPKLVVAHSDVLSWWRAVKGEDAPVNWNRYREMVRAGLNSAEAVVAPSNSALADVIYHYGPLRRTAVIPNGRKISFRQAEKQPFIFSSGRLWDEAKNIRALAETAGALAWPVHVAGDTTEPGQRPESPCDSVSNVHLLGRLNASQMAEQFERASIYCLPVRYEPFGLSALEAALAGCALVLGDIPSQREIWGDTASFVDPNDINALRGALQQLIADPTRRRELAERAFERAQNFSSERMASGYLALYSDLMAQSKTLEVACA